MAAAGVLAILGPSGPRNPARPLPVRHPRAVLLATAAHLLVGHRFPPQAFQPENAPPGSCVPSSQSVLRGR